MALTGEALGLEGFAMGADARTDAPPALYPLVLDNTRAFVKIQDGCDLSCSFCLTTVARGAARSRPLGSILAEVRSLVARGCQEVVLTGVHAGAYGKEMEGAAELGQLVQRLLEETALPRLRLSSLEPWNFQAAWLEQWAPWLAGDSPRLCRHLHMSLQSGSDGVLRRMRRAYTAGTFAGKVATIREAIPGVAITTDLIVGFPGETEAEHQESLDFVANIGFADAHIFAFSPRPGTRAATLPQQLSGRVKKERHAAMRAVTERSARAFREGMVGSRQAVLWEVPDATGRASGLTDRFLRVHSHDPRATRNRLSLVRLGTLEGSSFCAEWPEG